MHVGYITCIKCGQLSPSPQYFYAKGELTEEEKKTCIWEIEAEKERLKSNEPLQFKLNFYL